MRWVTTLACAVATTVLFFDSRLQSQEPDGDQTEVKPAPVSEELAQLIGDVRANEELYRHLETTLERTVEAAEWQNPKSPLKFLRTETARTETARTVRQDGMIRFEGEETRLLPTGAQVKDERLSCYDGERTVSIEAGNSVNIHEGRYESSDIVPPHSWALASWYVNFPLSVFLEGTQAIQTPPKYRSHPSIYQFARLECRIDGREEIDGLDCTRLQCERWYRPTGNPTHYTLWLAPERNYLCVKAQSTDGKTGKVRSETVVEEMKEISSGVWLPQRLVTTTYRTSADAKPTVVRREVTQVVQAAVNPTYPTSFFWHSGESDDLPVYRIQGDRLGDSPIHWEAVESSNEHLARIVEAIRVNEAGYAQFEANLRDTYREFAGGSVSEMAGGGRMVSCTVSEATLRSVIDGKRTFVREEKESHMADGATSRSARLYAYDGHWTRSLYTYEQSGREPAISQRSAGLQQGRSKHTNVWRPHSVVVRSLDEYRPLSEILESDEFESAVPRVEYLGEQERQGLTCDVLRIVAVSRKSQKPYLVELLWLARDRNYLPIRRESYTLRWSERLPTAVTEVTDLREIAAGTYFPMRVITNRFESFEKGGLVDNRLIVRWQREWIVDDVTLTPDVSPGLFEAIAVPAETRVFVSDAEGNSLGSFEQPESGNLSVAPEELEAMKVLAEKRKRDREERIAAMNALLDQPAPAFPEAKWLNSEPLTWEKLKGKVVLLDFWAVWCGPCRPSLAQLAESYESLKGTGVVVIGVHTAGSKLEDVEKLAQDEKLGFPICIDTPPTEHRAWGTLFGKYAVHQIPCSYVVDKTGKIVAHGELRETLPKARSLAK